MKIILCQHVCFLQSTCAILSFAEECIDVMVDGVLAHVSRGEVCPQGQLSSPGDTDFSLFARRLTLYILSFTCAHIQICEPLTQTWDARSSGARHEGCRPHPGMDSLLTALTGTKRSHQSCIEQHVLLDRLIVCYLPKQ